MGFATGLQAGGNLVSSDMVQMIGLKKERKRAGKLIEEFKAKLEEYQLSENELSQYEKIQLSVLANQIGSDYAKSLDALNTSQSSFDKEKMSQEYQTLRSKNDSLTTLIKEMKDNPYLSQANLSALDDMTGMPFSKLWNKETLDGISNEETKQQTLDNVFGVAKELPTEYTLPYMEGQGVEGLTGLQPTTTPKEPTPLSAKDNWAIENYKTGKISFDQLSKYMGTKIEPEKATALEQKISEAKQYGATNDEIKKMIVGGAGGGGTPTSYKTLQDIKDSFKNVKTKAEYDEALATYNSSKEAQTSDWTPPPFGNQLTNLIKKVESALWSDYVNKDGKLKSKTDADEYNTRLQYYLNLIEEARKAGVDVSAFQAFKPYKSLYGGMGNPLVTSESW